MPTDGPPTLTREERLEVMLRSGVAERTLRNFLEGRARPASAKRIEAALEQMARERLARTPAAGPSPSA